MRKSFHSKQSNVAPKAKTPRRGRKKKYISPANAIKPEDVTRWNSTNSPQKTLPVTDGSILWLDALDPDTLQVDKGGQLKSWNSKSNLDMAQFGLFQNKLRRDEHASRYCGRYPSSSAVNRSPRLCVIPSVANSPGMWFDFCYTGVFTRRISKIRTIASFHSFETDERKANIGERDGFQNTFYILTSSNNMSFHGGTNYSKQLSDTTYADVGFQNGTIRYGCDPEEFVIRKESVWGVDGRVAIVSLANEIDGVERIGRDRTCHQYSGCLCELILYDRLLTDDEKLQVASYLLRKWYGPLIVDMFDAINSTQLLNVDCADVVVEYVFGVRARVW